MARCGCGYNHAGERVKACAAHRNAPWRAKQKEYALARRARKRTEKKGGNARRKRSSK